MNFFQILHDKEQIYNQKVVVIEIPEWKLKAKIARNTTYLKKIRTKFLPAILGQK